MVPYLGNVSHICKGITNIWLVRDAPEPRTKVRNVCPSASQAYTL